VSTNPNLADDLRAAIEEASRGDGITLTRSQIRRWAETGEWPWKTKRLASRGQVYVTYAAAKRYQAQRGLADLEEARRELTTHLLDATLVGDGDGKTTHWRFRSRASGLDVSAVIVREGRLLVVLSINARTHAEYEK